VSSHELSEWQAFTRFEAEQQAPAARRPGVHQMEGL